MYLTCDVTQYVAVFVVALVQQMFRHACYFYHLSACGTWGEESTVLKGSERVDEGENACESGRVRGRENVCMRVCEGVFGLPELFISNVWQ